MDHMIGRMLDGSEWWASVIAAWGDVLELLCEEDADVAEVWLENKSEHLADLLRESILGIEQAPATIVGLIYEDWVLYDCR